MSVCMNCNTHGVEDMDVISHLIKIRLKPKVLLNHYMLCVRCGGVGAGGQAGRWQEGSHSPSQHPLACLVSRELLSAHKDNLGTTIKFVVFNELSNARNPNNMQILYTVLQHSSELAPKVGCLGTWQPSPGLESSPWCVGLASSLGAQCQTWGLQAGEEPWHHLHSQVFGHSR